MGEEAGKSGLQFGEGAERQCQKTLPSGDRCQSRIGTADGRRRHCDAHKSAAAAKDAHPSTKPATQIPLPRPPRRSKDDYVNLGLLFNRVFREKLAPLSDNAARRAYVRSLLEAPPPIIQKVPPRIRAGLSAAWGALCANVLTEQEAHPYDPDAPSADPALELAWAAVALFGRLILPASGGKAVSGGSQADWIASAIDLLKAGDLEGLVARSRTRAEAALAKRKARAAAPDVAGAQEASLRRQAEQLTQAGLISRGLQVTCRRTDGPVPSAELADQLLRPLHPDAPPPEEVPESYAPRMEAARAFLRLPKGHAMPPKEAAIADFPADTPEATKKRALEEADDAELMLITKRSHEKAAGPDLLGPSILYQLLADYSSARRATMGVIRLIQDGRLPPLAAEFFSLATLIGLVKSAPGALEVALRPVAIGDFLLRLAASLLVRAHKAAIEASGGRHQYGTSKCGIEGSYAAGKATLTAHPDWVIVELDIRNAFNEALRQELLCACHERLPALFPMVWSLYGRSTGLLYRLPDGSHKRLESARGSRQGDPFGGVLFNLVFRNVLDFVETTFPTAVQFAYMDNHYIVAPPALAAEVVKAVGPELAKVLLTLKPAKSTAWSPTPLSQTDLGALLSAGIPAERVARPEEGLIVLGSPLGHTAWMEAKAVELVETQFAVLKDPRHLVLSAHSRWLQFLYAISKRVGHLARSVPPGAMARANDLARGLLEVAFASLFKLTLPLRPDTAGLLPLPMREGGMGLLALALEPAYLAGTLRGRLAVLTKLTAPGPPLSPSDALLLAAAQAISGPTYDSGSLTAAYESLAASEVEAARLALAAGRKPKGDALALPPGEEPLWAPPQGPLSKILPNLEAPLHPKLQSALTNILHELRLEEWRHTASPDRDADRLSTMGPGGNTWLASMPGRSAYATSCTWPGETFITAVQLYLIELPSVLRAAGYLEGRFLCWVHRSERAVGYAETGAGPLGPGTLGGQEEGAESVEDVVDAMEVCEADEEDAGGEHSQKLLPTPPRAAVAHPMAPPLPPPPLPACASLRLPDPGARHRCGVAHALAPGEAGWSSLLKCNKGGFRLRLHNSVAGVLAGLAPRLPPTNLGVPAFPTASQPLIGKILTALAPGRSDWPRPDVFSPEAEPDGRPLFQDVTAWAVPRGASGGPRGALGAVEDVLARAISTKILHYKNAGCTGPGGPMGPGTANFRDFAFLARGRLGKTALSTLKEWARKEAAAYVGDAPEGDMALRLRASVILRSYYRIISTTIWRMHASRIHEVAMWLAEDLASSAGPGDVDNLNTTTYMPLWAGAPALGDLPQGRPLGLADLDEAGLALAAITLVGAGED